MSCTKWLNNRTSLKNDCCETSWRNVSNKILSDYTFSVKPTCTIDPEFLCEPNLNQQFPNLLCDNVNVESNLQNGCIGNRLTHCGEKRQLDIRAYRTVPYMGVCRSSVVDIDTNSMIITGENTRTSKSCGPESVPTRLTPLVPCIKQNIQNPVNHVPRYWVRGGMSTSAYYRNIDYLKACGIKKCKSSCEKMFCPERIVPENVRNQKLQGMNLPCLPGGMPLRRAK